MHYHVTEITGEMGLHGSYRCERQVPCPECDWGHPLPDEPGDPKAWVLWHQYGDGSGAHIERVYTDVERAREDYRLIAEGNACKTSASEWKLEVAPLFKRMK
jgi:hypothetical protein